MEIHRNKLNKVSASEEISPKTQMNDTFNMNPANNGVGSHQRPEVAENFSVESKGHEHLNDAINSVEVTKNGKQTLRNSSVLKEEDPSSVTSSGCSPPIKSNSSSPKRARDPYIKDNTDDPHQFEHYIKPEPSSTKDNNNQTSTHVDDKYLSIRLMSGSPKHSSSTNELNEGNGIHSL